MVRGRKTGKPRRAGKARPRTVPQATPTEAILESISDGVFTVDLDWRITSFNRAAEEITGVAREDAIGRRCAEVFRSSMCGADCALGQTLETGQPVIGTSAYIIDAAGSRIPISVSTAVLRDGRGKPVGGAETFRDLSLVEALRHELDGRFRVGDLAAAARSCSGSSRCCRRSPPAPAPCSSSARRAPARSWWPGPSTA